jgi:hypothetical protein
LLAAWRAREIYDEVFVNKLDHIMRETIQLKEFKGQVSQNWIMIALSLRNIKKLEKEIK